MMSFYNLQTGQYPDKNKRKIFLFILSTIMVFCLISKVYSKDPEIEKINKSVVINNSPKNASKNHYCFSTSIINQPLPYHKFTIPKNFPDVIELEKIIFWGFDPYKSPNILFEMYIYANDEKYVLPPVLFLEPKIKHITGKIFQYEAVFKMPIQLNKNLEYRLTISAHDKFWAWLKKEDALKGDAEFCYRDESNELAYVLYRKIPEKIIYEIGDVDHDGKLTPEDALLIASYITKEPLKGKIDLSLADFNQDGFVTICDCIMIIRKLIEHE